MTSALAIAVLGGPTLLTGTALAGPEPSSAAYVGRELAGQARIGMERARAIALRAHPGQVIDRELERERGGSGLRYSFDIRSRRGVWEVGVDARTGRVLENKKEGPHPD